MPAEPYPWLPIATVTRWLKIAESNVDALAIAEECRQGSAEWIQDQRPDLFPATPNLVAFPRGTGWTTAQDAAIASDGAGLTVTVGADLAVELARTITGLTPGDTVTVDLELAASAAPRTVGVDGTWETALTAVAGGALAETVALPDTDPVELASTVTVAEDAAQLALDLTYTATAPGEVLTVSRLEIRTTPAVPPRILSAAQLAVARLYARRDSPNGVVAFQELGAGALLARDPDIRRLLGRSKLVVG